MSNAIMIPLMVFGLGFIISLGMAIIIKTILKVIHICANHSKELN